MNDPVVVPYLHIEIVHDLFQAMKTGSANEADQVKYRDKLAHYRRLVTAIHKYIDVNRLLSSIDADLRRPAKVYTSLVDDLDRLDAVLSTLDREHPLEKQSLYVLQVIRSQHVESSDVHETDRVVYSRFYLHDIDILRNERYILPDVNIQA
jgi:hypothetical protein